MSWRLRLTIFGSVLFHAGMIFLLASFSLFRARNAVDLTPAGGVVWLNLDAGGEGSGGEGGLGAPEKGGQEEAAQKKSETDSSRPMPPDQAVKKTEGPPRPPKEKPKANLHVASLPPVEKPENEKKPKPAEAPALPGPGQGDDAGTKTGPGGGAGQGQGDGAKSGTGPGEGPGGVGPLGSGGEGSGGQGDKTLGLIRSKILRAKRYPPEARREGIEGICGVQFAIQPDGSLLEVKLMESSGYEALDREALATVRRAAPFPYYASPIRFKLRFSLKDR